MWRDSKEANARFGSRSTNCSESKNGVFVNSLGPIYKQAAFRPVIHTRIATQRPPEEAVF